MERMQATRPDLIGGDRRADKRYEIHLDLRWKLVRRRRVLETGSGHTVDLSSGGILFEAGRQLPVGFHLEISISWPIMLHSVSPLQLVVKAKIVRSEDGRTAVRILQHEFRTAGQAAEPRSRTATGSPLRLVPGLDRGTRLAKIQ
jgi:c-di-GMP-binding flagellar brake protein YcgR